MVGTDKVCSSVGPCLECANVVIYHELIEWRDLHVVNACMGFLVMSWRWQSRDMHVFYHVLDFECGG